MSPNGTPPLPAPPHLLPETILAILAHARESGHSRLTTTALVKFAYLVDYFTAVETNGRPFTATPWQFLHFGPYHSSVSTVIESLVGSGAIDESSGGSTDKDYYLFSLASHKSAPNLDELGVPPNARMELVNKFRECATDLTKLLNFVYYHTEPMQDIKPRQTLSFSGCEKVPWQSIRPVAMNKISPDKLSAYRAMLAERKSQPEAAPIHWEGKYDEVYFGALAELDAAPVEETGTFILHLQ